MFEKISSRGKLTALLIFTLLPTLWLFAMEIFSPINSGTKECDYIQGEWLLRKNPPLRLDCSKNTSGCTGLDFQEDIHRWNHSKPLYAWKSKCNMNEFSPQLFCDLLNGRKLVFVGDSLIYQIYLVLHYLFNVYEAGELCLQNVSYVGSDTLHGHGFCYWNRGLTLKEIIANGDYDVVVTGAGAHMCGHNESHALQNFATMLREVNQVAAESNATFIWRSQMPAHSRSSARCDIFTTPWKHYERFGEYMNFSDFQWWNHALFKQYDSLSEGILVNKIVQMKMYPLRLRPDAHVAQGDWDGFDCLHYTQPGVFIWVLELLQNILRDHQT